MSKGPFEPKNPLPTDDRVSQAHEYAERQIEKLNALLKEHGQPPVALIERPMLVTYIKAKQLGLIDAD